MIILVAKRPVDYSEPSQDKGSGGEDQSHLLSDSPLQLHYHKKMVPGARTKYTKSYWKKAGFLLLKVNINYRVNYYAHMWVSDPLNVSVTIVLISFCYHVIMIV